MVRVILIFILVLTGCSDMKNMNQSVRNKLTTVEYQMLNHYDKGKKVPESVLDYRVLLGAVAGREKRPPSSAIPFCDVIQYISLVTNNSRRKLDVQLKKIYGTLDLKCDSGIKPKALQTPKDPAKPVISIDTLTKLTEAAGDCNVAKISVINQGGELSEEEGLRIIRDCKVFKLQQELQDG